MYVCLLIIYYNMCLIFFTQLHMNVKSFDNIYIQQYKPGKIAKLVIWDQQYLYQLWGLEMILGFIV